MTPDSSHTPRPAAAGRLRTVALGAVPVVLLGLAVSTPTIPGTDISLAVPYAAEGPGPTFNTLGEVDGEQVIEITGARTDETEGNLDMTTVSVRTNMTMAQALGRWLFTEDTMVPIDHIFPADMDPEQIKQSNEAAFTESESAATIAAMNHLDRPTEVVVARVLDGTAATGVFAEEDTILAVDGVEVQRPTEVAERAQAKKPGEEITFTVERDGREQELDLTLGELEQNPGVGAVGILMTSQPGDGVEVDYNLQDVGGPSAGMMFSLAVIDKLSPGPLNGGKFVAGTGTITPDGAVGPIGGIVHKVDAAEAQGAELFLAPAENCAEAVSRDHGDMVVASVANLDEAIAAMDTFAAGGEVTTCQPR
ncbi:YlbL family protein [Corynebacterium guangdongense]|uniref:endopeptidase La n=1 Tax=Corynebacterium guangdongense TaxID=1783348 RepID=A0ABU1ZXV2_9CORY|nr:PDZ domain-containing protein [Corynebacterium guangdongense]MDR7328728.1 PDZ domain-containing protein [Corynebacterium guangdongense]